MTSVLTHQMLLCLFLNGAGNFYSGHLNYKVPGGNTHRGGWDYNERENPGALITV